MRSGLQRHGDLLAFARDVARSRGWDAEIQNMDIDPIDSGICTVRDEGRGDLVLTCGDSGSTFEYHLPEQQKHLRADILCAIQGDAMDRDRRAAGGIRPIEVR